MTGVDWLTPVNQTVRCVRKIERQRTVSFKLPEPLHAAYIELPSASKTLVKTVVASLIYALAKKHGIEVECEEQLRAFVSDAPAPSGQIIINANIAEARAEAKARVKVDLKELEEVKRLLEDLLSLARAEGRGRRILEQRVRRALQVLDRLALN